jgi:hypothetical protein
MLDSVAEIGSSKRLPMFEDLLETQEGEDRPRFDAPL